MVSRALLLPRFLKQKGVTWGSSQNFQQHNNVSDNIYQVQDQVQLASRKCLSTVSVGESNIILMGCPGSGKTTIGQLLSPRLGMPIVDIDNDVLEVHWNTSVADKLSHVGAQKFIEEEGEALLQFKATNSIVSLSGSNPLHTDGMRHVAKTGPVFYLDVNSQDILNRLEVMKVDRIVGQGPNTSIADILRYRKQFYEDVYDFRIICEQNETPESIADKLIKQLNQLHAKRVYSSTRASSSQNTTQQGSNRQKDDVHFLDTVLQGLAPDGGLYVPTADYPRLTQNEWERLVQCSYQERALRILEKWVHPLDIHPRRLNTMIQQAYGPSNFDNKEVVPVVHLHDNQYVMEIFHGPTASFKDAALQLMPQFFTEAVVNSNQDRRYLILVATSGDTGSAVLDGFAKYAGESGSMVMVLYPEQGVSPVQKALMTSAEGSNVHVIGVDSDFDFCQSAIKKIFNDNTIRQSLQSTHGVSLSAANSINWGRLLPQVVYHASAYLDMVKKGVMSMGDECDLCVPTGNFGNILGAVYAKNMGIPIRKFICASNENNVLTDFFKTGVYDLRHRSLQVTISPAIDILKSSNLERFLHFMTDGDGEEVARYFNQLNSEKFFEVSPKVMDKIKNDWGFVADWCNQEECAETIKNVFNDTGYLLDPHTAVAKAIADRQPSTDRPLLLCATAHYGKFASDVVAALGYDVSSDFLFGKLEGQTRLPTMHQELARSLRKPCLHKGVVSPNVNEIVKEMMGFIDRVSLNGSQEEQCV